MSSDLYPVQFHVQLVFLSKKTFKRIICLLVSLVFKSIDPLHKMVQSLIAIFTENNFHCTSRYKYATIKL